MTVLSIDQGTTSTRALLVDESGSFQIIAAIEHEQRYPQPGWVEHDPQELINNISLCMKRAIEISPDLSAIGIDNQGESCLAWDAESKKAISPVIVWQDNRTQAVIDQLVADGVESEVRKITGLPLDSYFSASKLAWIIHNIPEAKSLLKRGKLRLGTTDAFFLDQFTGCYVTDISTASRTSLMNLQTGQWDEAMCRLFCVPIEALPEIVATTGDFGCVSIDGKSIAVTASIVDQPAALYGQDCKAPGDIKVTFGTGAFALAITGKKPLQSTEQGILPTVAWKLDGQETVYAIDGAIYSAGSAINWAKSLGLFESYDQINQFSKPSAIERKLVFVPALSGLACPHWDRRAGGLWLGLSLDTTAEDMMQSMLEGIACRAAEVVAAINAVSPIKADVLIDGGLSANPYFCQFLADVLNRQVVVQSFAEITAAGTAKLAALKQGKLEISAIPTICYQPETSRHSSLEVFKEAIIRSLNWH